MNLRIAKATQKILDVAANIELANDVRLKLIMIAQDLMQGQIEHEEQLKDLRDLLQRNPAFPNDLAARLDDDVDLTDDEDDENTAS